MVGRDEIIAAVRFHAAQNGRTAPGVRRFAELSGIADHEWSGRYWARSRSRSTGPAPRREFLAGITPANPDAAARMAQMFVEEA